MSIQFTEKQMKMIEAEEGRLRMNEWQRERRRDPKFQEQMKKIREEVKEEKKKSLEASRIANNRYAEKQKQRRLDAEKVKATNPELYAEMYPPNVFHNNSDTK